MNLGHDDGPCAPCAVSALPPWMTAGRDRARLALPMRLCPAMLPLLAGLAACGGGTSSTGFSSGVGSASATPGSTGSTSSTADSSSTSAGEGDNSTGSTSTSSGSAADSTPVFDMPIPDGGPAVPEGCKGKIDFLFVVSADDTMTSKQERLLASFPGFMQAIEDQLPEFDVHILSADDGYWNQMDCSLCKDDCDPGGSPPLCGAVLEFCDKEIGAGVTFPAGRGCLESTLRAVERSSVYRQYGADRTAGVYLHRPGGIPWRLAHSRANGQSPSRLQTAATGLLAR
jgi:hypothetical protein